MKIYYAHPVSIYNTQQEQRDLALLANLGDVVNPNSAEHAAGYQSAGMEYFKAIVQACNLLAFRAFPNGAIPAGIAAEIQFAAEHGLPVIELPNCIASRTLSVDQTRTWLRECGFR